MCVRNKHAVVVVDCYSDTRPAHTRFQNDPNGTKKRRIFSVWIKRTHKRTFPRVVVLVRGSFFLLSNF